MFKRVDVCLKLKTTIPTLKAATSERSVFVHAYDVYFIEYLQFHEFARSKMGNAGGQCR